VIGGPSNSLVKHGVGDRRGHCPERTVLVERDGTGKVKTVGTRYHMTEPVRVTLTERRDLTMRTVGLVEEVSDVTGADDVLYVTMFPRHVDKCCNREGHMTDGDCLTVASVRIDLDKDIVASMREVPGSNAFVTKDWVGRLLFNCILYGERVVRTPEQIRRLRSDPAAKPGP